MASHGGPAFDPLLSWVVQHYPGGERQLLADSHVHRRTLQRWRRQGAPERGSRALDAVDAAARSRLPDYPPPDYPGGGLPVLVGERTAGEARDGADGDAAVPSEVALEPGGSPAAADEVFVPAPRPRPRSRLLTLLPWSLVALLAAFLLDLTLRGATPEDGGGAGRPMTGTSTLAPPGTLLAVVDLSGLAENDEPYVGSFTQPAIQRNCDGTICSGSPRRISNHFDGDPIFVLCQVAGEWVEVGRPGQPGWFGGSTWLKLFTAEGDRWISNTWVLRRDLRDADVPICM